MEKRELVSVIIPVYNVEAYLTECIDSVLAQTYPDMEIILVDDGSTDASGKICDSYENQDSRITVIHQENRGLSEARNTGLDRAKGEYIYFLDSDDWILPETLELLTEKAETDSANVVFFDARSFEDEQPDKVIQQNYMRKHNYETDTGLAVLKQLQENKDYHSAVPLLFIRKSVLDNMGLRFEPGILYEDMIFTYALFCKAGRVAYVNQSFYQRRYRSNSIMTSKKTEKNYRSMLTVYEQVKRISLDLYISETDIAIKYIVRCAFNVFHNYDQLSHKEKIKCKQLHENYIINVKACNGYNDKSLYYRCYGKLAWLICKIFQRMKRF